MLTAKRLREVLDYEPKTGKFRWKLRVSLCIRVGDEAGCKSRYVMIRIDGVLYRENRLAFLYMTGEWQRDDIDHRNNDKTDNRWINLRDADKARNGWNRPATIQNKSGYKGVCWHKKAGKWAAQIQVRG